MNNTVDVKIIEQAIRDIGIVRIMKATGYSNAGVYGWMKIGLPLTEFMGLTKIAKTLEGLSKKHTKSGRIYLAKDLLAASKLLKEKKLKAND